MGFTRRDLLLLGGGLIVGAAGGRWLERGAAPVPSRTSVDVELPSGLVVFALGEEGTRHPARLGGYGDPIAVLTEIALPSGRVRQTPLPLPSAHLATLLPDGRILCVSSHGDRALLLSRDHEVQKTLVAPRGYLYSGHGLVLEKRDRVLLPLRRDVARTAADTGRLQVLGLERMEPLDLVDTRGLHPHEPRLLPGGDEIALSHYGELAGRSSQAPYFYYNAVEPKLTVLDAGSLAVKRQLVQPGPAVFTHIDVGPDGAVYGVENQYLADSPDARAFLEERFGKESLVSSRLASLEERRALPTPVVRIDPASGARQELSAGPSAQLRAQSVAVHAGARRVFATFVYSNTLVVADIDGGVTAVPASSYGIYDVRGVAPLPGTPFVALSGTEHNVAVVDATTLERVAFFEVQLYAADHLSAASSSV